MLCYARVMHLVATDERDVRNRVRVRGRGRVRVRVRVRVRAAHLVAADERDVLVIDPPLPAVEIRVRS